MSQTWTEMLVEKLDLKAFPVLSVGILEKQALFVLEWLLRADWSEGEDI